MRAVQEAVVLLVVFQVICSFTSTVSSQTSLAVKFCSLRSEISQVDWQKVEQSTLFSLSSGQGQPSQETVVRVCHNATHLFIRYDCEDNNVSIIYQSCNDPVWQADAVELMIGRGSDSDYPRYYHELDLGPHPALFAATISNPNDNCTEIQDYYLQCNTLGMAWEAHQGNTLLNKDGWWAVMIISFDFLASVPAQSDSLRQSHHEIRSNRGTYLATTWRANFYRVDSPKDSGRLEYSSWQPTDMVPPCFHVPSKFGVLNITN